MKIVSVIFVALLVSIFFSSSSAHFFPNISSIPRTLTRNKTAAAWEGFSKLLGCRRGQNVVGLSRLKQYFQHFGYLNNPLNFTDHFDDEFESALKTYQLNFNLNATGELDTTTLTQILRPRCGNPDVINGSSTMNSGKVKNSDAAHLHTVAHYSFFPGRPSWPSSRRDLTYAFLPENQLSDEVKSVFARAFQRWSEVIPLTFTETASYSSADMRIGFFSGDHGDGEPFDGVFGTLAHAFSPPSGRFHLDLDENWVVVGDSTNAPSSAVSAVDLESVAVHEIGHLLGLGHSAVQESIMYPTISSNIRKVELHEDDIQGVQTLYGSNPSYNGSSLLERATSGAHTSVGSFWCHVSLLWAVGSILLSSAL